MYVDSHCHLYNEYYTDISSVIKTSQNSGINYFINAGCSVKSNKEILQNKLLNTFNVIGYHPEEANNINQEDLNLLENQIKNYDIIGIGEIGLDYHYENINKEKQKYLFDYQISLAEKYHLPIVVHSRDATLDTISILKKHNVKGVIHSFSGSLSVAQEYIKMGFLLGVNGVITFKNCKLIEVYKIIGIDNIVLETDSPYLTPVPLRGKQNIPGNITYIVDFLANNLNVSKEKISLITNDNLKKCFKISI